ncbi:alpha-L-fucosidase [Chitinophaga deserti]|uniref:alpha-L-fucosidase n=1 Tax=Chitinophaga deserti TaxID=2164099 RepID=UPI000D6B6A55|nr:alpha-L-fucosidase [Chitinophaga deserti]
MKGIFSKIVLLAAGMLWTVAGFTQPLPTAAQLAWQRAELGVVFHYDLHVFDGKQYGQGSNRISPVPDYNIFKPSQLDTDQWVKAAKDAGARFAILTVTHETGFALYQSDVNPYCMKALQWKNGKGDIVADFVKSCRKYGLEPGLYIGIRWNAFMGVHDFKVQGEKNRFLEARQQYYNRMVEGMVTELCTRYGPLFEIWFDGGASDPADGAPDVLSIVEKYQPNTLFYWNGQRSDARWGGSETGTVGYPCWSSFPYPSMLTGRYPAIAEHNFALAKHGDSTGKYWLPAMSDAPLRGHNGRHEWFWEPGDEHSIYPLSNLIQMYEHSAGRNSTLILGLTPDTAGLMPAPDVERLKEFGDAIRKRFGNPIASYNGKGDIEIRLPSVQVVNQVMIGEDVAKGERILSFVVEAKTGGRWKQVYAGTAAGNKHIATFAPVKASAMRLRVTQQRNKPAVIVFNAYFNDEIKPI